MLACLLAQSDQRRYLRGGGRQEEAAVGEVGAVVGGAAVAVQARLRGQEDEVEDVAQLGPALLFCVVCV